MFSRCYECDFWVRYLLLERRNVEWKRTTVFGRLQVGERKFDDNSVTMRETKIHAHIHFFFHRRWILFVLNFWFFNHIVTHSLYFLNSIIFIVIYSTILLISQNFLSQFRSLLVCMCVSLSLNWISTLFKQSRKNANWWQMWNWFIDGQRVSCVLLHSHYMSLSLLIVGNFFSCLFDIHVFHWFHWIIWFKKWIEYIVTTGNCSCSFSLTLMHYLQVFCTSVVVRVFSY